MNRRYVSFGAYLHFYKFWRSGYKNSVVQFASFIITNPYVTKIPKWVHKRSIDNYSYHIGNSDSLAIYTRVEYTYRLEFDRLCEQTRM